MKRTSSIGMLLVLIPPGEFDMGSTPEQVAWTSEQGKRRNLSRSFSERVPSESPQHRVKITRPFYLGMYVVTQADYKKVMGVNPSGFTARPLDASAFQPMLSRGEVNSRSNCTRWVGGKDTRRYPVETVTWDQAVEFCRKLSAMPAERTAKRSYRLPTEAEWEYACRAGTTTAWYCGDDEAGVDDVAWCSKNGGDATHPVGEKRPNAWGLYDMCGNVSQWCADWFGADYYQHSPLNDPEGPPRGAGRLYRNDAVYGSLYCRSAYRSSDGPVVRRRDIGFRVVADVATQE